MADSHYYRAGFPVACSEVLLWLRGKHPAGRGLAWWLVAAPLWPVTAHIALTVDCAGPGQPTGPTGPGRPRTRAAA